MQRDGSGAAIGVWLIGHDLHGDARSGRHRGGEGEGGQIFPGLYEAAFGEDIALLIQNAQLQPDLIAGIIGKIQPCGAAAENGLAADVGGKTMPARCTCVQLASGAAGVPVCAAASKGGGVNAAVWRLPPVRVSARTMPMTAARQTAAAI